ncbi:hypothetical protein G765_03647 [Escherichia coli HVH 104 (4-6977960)]|nr:hypothetical protein G737_05132 [Escherichia coli HVH 73 (4-2393174)]EQQ47494.1 hypothetical protein G765_03647 [Escherichia coli HVH 104 (4-6977960)]
MTGACVRDYTVLAAAGLLTNARKSYNCVNVSVSSAALLQIVGGDKLIIPFC